MDAVTVLPQLVVAVDGCALDGDHGRALGEIVISQQLSLPSQCELTFFDLPVEAPSSALTPGARIEVRRGADTARLFAGEITAVNDHYGPDQGRELRVRCYDRLHRLRLRQPVRSHAEQSLADFVRAMVADLGVRVQASDSGPTLRWLVQHQQSDLELLRAATGRAGYYFYLCDDVLHLVTLAGRDGAACELRRGATLLEATVDVNAGRSWRRVDACAWDPWRAAPSPGSAGTARSGRQVAAAPAPVAEAGPCTIAGRVAQDAAQADALAQGELDRRHANAVVLSGIAEGNPALQPAAAISVEGLAAEVNGRYVLTRAVHRLDRISGYLTEIDTAVAEPAPRREGSAMTFGVVADVADPQGLGRVRVRLPGFADSDSLWLQVLHPGAGVDKGLVATPAVADRVLVLYADDDPAQGVVLGGLFGETPPPDAAGVAGGVVRRFQFRTAGGQRLILDDDRRRVRVESQGGEFIELAPERVRAGTSDGSFLELAARRVRLHARADLDIEAPGQAITIRGRSIDFEQA